MIPFKTPIGDFEIPNSLEDLTVGDLLFYRDHMNEPLKVLERMTGFPREKLSLLDLDPIVIHLDFLKTNAMEDIEPSQSIEIKGQSYNLPDDIGASSWNQKLLANQALRNGEPIDVLALYLQPLYERDDFDELRIEATKEMIYELGVVPAYSSIIFLINQLKDIAKKELDRLKSEVSFEQKQAGIDAFNELGDFNTILMISKEFRVLPKEALKIDYNTVFLTLLSIKITAKFEKRYNEIINRSR
jgi:hypothetical protein